MFYRLIVNLRKPGNQLWLMPTAGALLALLIAAAAAWVNVFVPPSFLPDIDLNTLQSLLDVIASSMLAVSTFSLSIMVSAFSSASNGATPRATELVMSDDNTRMAIASFISAFIYAIIARVALGLGYYGQNGRFALFIATLFVLLYLIITLIRWVHTLSLLGRLANTLSKIKAATQKPLREVRLRPNLGATWQGTVDDRAKALRHNKSGFLTHIDLAGLQKKAEDSDCYLHIMVRPGEMILPSTVLALVQFRSNDDSEQALANMRSCFVVDVARSFEQDPAWGFLVMSEAGQRALSPAVNDPGTAIQVMYDLMSLLIEEVETDEAQASDSGFDRLSIVAIDYQEWLVDAFLPLMRDGGHMLEVNLVMQKVLAGIAQHAPESGVRHAAKEVAEVALERAEKALVFDADRQRLREKHERLFA
ncbi:DUF2254 domain-containing protein [Oligella urethralis]|nr:DUF2254 domain-containing protein [Oligella urethralis]